jgi:hypothetical protein
LIFTREFKHIPGLLENNNFTFLRPNPRHNPRMTASQQLLDSVVAAVLNQFAPHNLRADEIAVTLVDLAAGKNFPHAGHRGDADFYPASVVKLFYLAATHRWLEDKKIPDTPELRRALHDMIVHSGNEATGHVVDVLTDTTSGPELPPAELAAWHEKRNAVNRRAVWPRQAGRGSIHAGEKFADDQCHRPAAR